MFSIDAAFDGMTTVHNGPVQHIFHALAGGKQNLTLDQIDIRNHLCDRVLDLNAGIHFDEVKPSILIHEELDSAGVNVADIRQSLTENSPDIFSQFRRHLGGGRLLEQLLMPPLNRAFALAQARSEEHTSELQSPDHLVCRLLLEKKKEQWQRTSRPGR